MIPSGRETEVMTSQSGGEVRVMPSGGRVMSWCKELENLKHYN